MSSKRLKAFFKGSWNKDRPPSPLVEPDPARQNPTGHSASRPLDPADSIKHASLVSYNAQVAVTVSSQPSNAIVTGPASAVADRTDTLAVPAEALEPQNATTSVFEALSPSTTAAEPSTTSAPASEPSLISLQERLLVEAYKALKSGEPKVVDAYEKVLSVKVKDIDSEPNDEVENRIAAFTQEEWARMKQMIDDGLKKREKTAAVYKKINDVIQFATPMKPVISQVLQASPPAATAWIGVSLALEVSKLTRARSIADNFQIVVNPFKESASNIDGITYVVSRMEWYWSLLSLLDTNPATMPSAEPHTLQRSLEGQFSKLYQKLLLYQMKSICRYYRNRYATFGRDLGRWDDWTSQLDAIKTSETALLNDLKTYNDQVVIQDSKKMHAFFQNIDTSVESMDRNLQCVTSAIQCLVTKMDKIQYDKESQDCRNDLFHTDPRDDRERIMRTKGGLLYASYQWILPEVRLWQLDPKSQRLWIRGAPGKGKTMLLCGIIEELEGNCIDRLCYFFCQATDSKLNNAVGVLRGLIYQLVQAYPWLLECVLEKYKDGGKKRFEGKNAWITLSKILESMLKDPCMDGVLLVVDALDEIVDNDDRRNLLDLIDDKSKDCPAKWIVSSRNEEDIIEVLKSNTAGKYTLSLESKSHLISKAVEAYINEKVRKLAESKGYDDKTRSSVEQRLRTNSNNTFLWVALVCQALEKVKNYNVERTLKTYPASLREFYERMLPNPNPYAPRDETLLRRILAIISVTERPVNLIELPNIVEIPDDISENLTYMEALVKSCGSFLNLQEGTIYFVHQSAVEFLKDHQFYEFPAEEDRHRAIFELSLGVLSNSRTIKNNIYNLQALGSSLSDIKPPIPNPLACLSYSCVHWIDHLHVSVRPHRKEEITLTPFSSTVEETNMINDPTIVGKITGFLRNKFLYWVEALILLGRMSEGIQAIQKLEKLIDTNLSEEAKALANFVRDANRLVLYNREVIEKYPLQLYASSLVFSPKSSIVRRHFRKDVPPWITGVSAIGSTWSGCLQRFRSDGITISSIDFSSDGRWLASKIEYKVKIWDAATGAYLRNIGALPDMESPIVLSGDSQSSAKLAIVSACNTVEVLDVETGTCLGILGGKRTLESGEANPSNEKIYSMAFSSDNCKIACGLQGGNVVIWDVESCNKIYDLPGHAVNVPSGKKLVAFSPDNSLLAAVSRKNTINIWDVQAALSVKTLGSSDGIIQCLAFSADSVLLALASNNVYVWDVTKESLRGKKRLRLRNCESLAFSPKAGSQLLAWASGAIIDIWNVATDTSVWKIDRHGYPITSLSFSPDGQRLASTGLGHWIEVWDVATYPDASNDHRSHPTIEQLVFSPDGGRTACYYGQTNAIGIRNIESGWRESLISVGEGQVSSLALSNDGEKVACAISGQMMIFSATTCALLKTIRTPFEGPSLVAFRNNQEITSLSSEAINTWEIHTGNCTQTLVNRYGEAACFALSPDGQWLACAYNKLCDRSVVQVLDLSTGEYSLAFDIYDTNIENIEFSSENSKLALTSFAKIEIWDTHNGVHLWTLKANALNCAHVSFDPNIESCLRTEFGYLDLNSFPANDPGAKVPVEFCGYGIGLGYGIGPNDENTRNWIMRDGKPVIWIPVEFQRSKTGLVVTPFLNGSTFIWSGKGNELMRIELSES